MKSWTEFLAMGGHGMYVWGSLLACGLAIVLEIWALARRRKALRRIVALAQVVDEMTSS